MHSCLLVHKKSSKVAVIFYALCTYSLVPKPQTFHVQNDFVTWHTHGPVALNSVRGPLD